MSSPPKNNMDPLLKAYAQQRRDKAGPALEMPAATRRVLQAEVAWTFPKTSEPTPWFRSFSGFWPRFALGGGLIAVLGLIALLSLKSERKMQNTFELASNRGGAQMTLPPQAPPASDREAANREVSSGRNSAVAPALQRSQANEHALAQASTATAREGLSRSTGEAQTVKLAVSPAPQDTVTDAKRVVTALDQAQGAARNDRNIDLADSSLKSDKLSQLAAKDLPETRRSELAVDSIKLGESLRDSYGVSRAPDTNTAQRLGTAQLAKAQDSRASAPSITGPAYYFQTQQVRGLAETESSTKRWLFNQIDSRARYRLNYNSPPMPKVLTSFQLQREGDQVLVIDADGSVYAGTVQSFAQAVAGAPAAVTLTGEKEKAVRRTQTERGETEERLKELAGPVGNAAEPQAIDNFSFYAVGTNRSLKQKVVFTGQYLNLNSAVSLQRDGSGGAGFGGAPGVANSSQKPQTRFVAPNQTQTATGLSPSSQAVRQNIAVPSAGPMGPGQAGQVLQSERIEGKASVGGKTELPIEALRVGP